MLILNGTKFNYAIMGKLPAKTYTCSHPYVLISIKEPGESKLTLVEDPNRVGILYLSFHDLTAPLESYKMMNEKQARAIVAFVNRHRHKIRGIACHCNAGISRSAGVIAALSLWLEGREFDEISQQLHPNTHVKSLILKVIRGGKDA